MMEVKIDFNKNEDVTGISETIESHGVGDDEMLYLTLDTLLFCAEILMVWPSE